MHGWRQRSRPSAGEAEPDNCGLRHAEIDQEQFIKDGERDDQTTDTVRVAAGLRGVFRERVAVSSCS